MMTHAGSGCKAACWHPIRLWKQTGGRTSLHGVAGSAVQPGGRVHSLLQRRRRGFRVSESAVDGHMMLSVLRYFPIVEREEPRQKRGRGRKPTAAPTSRKEDASDCERYLSDCKTTSGASGTRTSRDFDSAGVTPGCKAPPRAR